MSRYWVPCPYVSGALVGKCPDGHRCPMHHDMETWRRRYGPDASDEHKLRAALSGQPAPGALYGPGCSGARCGSLGSTERERKLNAERQYWARRGRLKAFLNGQGHAKG